LLFSNKDYVHVVPIVVAAPKANNPAPIKERGLKSKAVPTKEETFPVAKAFLHFDICVFKDS
jgi:hypothetical protein